MAKFSLITIIACLYLASCSSHKLPAFSNQQWHVDAYSGNAVSSSGLELAFGSEWMITDTTLVQSPTDIAAYPKLAELVTKGITQFPEIAIDSILFYNPHRGLLFTAYHQVKPLKPTSDICLYDDTTDVYSKEYARIFGNQYTAIDDFGWENGPTNSVYTNVLYLPKEKSVVLLQRIPYRGNNIAVFQIWPANAKRGRWLERISNMLQSSRNLAVENLKLSILRQKQD